MMLKWIPAGCMKILGKFSAELEVGESEVTVEWELPDGASGVNEPPGQELENKQRQSCHLQRLSIMPILDFPTAFFT
jgi:hypothetical protein